MIRFSAAIFIAAAMLLVLFAEGKEDKKGEKKDEKKPVAFTSKEGKFSVAFPEKPAEKTSKVKVGDREVDHHLFTAKQADRAQIVSYVDYDKAVVGEDKDKFLAGVVERNVVNLKGKVAVNEKVSLGKGKHPGRDVRVEMPDKKQLYRAQVFLVGNRLYQVVVLGPEEFVKGKEVDDYLKSFTVEE